MGFKNDFSLDAGNILQNRNDVTLLPLKNIELAIEFHTKPKLTRISAVDFHCRAMTHSQSF